MIVVASATLVACSGGTASPATIAPESSVAPLPTAPVKTAVTDTTGGGPTSTTSTTTAPTTTGAGTLPAGVVGLSADGPWRLVDSAPGITAPGLVYELMPKLWVYLPVKEDIAHGITWTFKEADRPIIEAYLHARLVYFQAITSTPIDLTLPGWKQYYADGGAVYFPNLQQRIAEGQVADLDVGVVLRPEVIGDGRTDTEAIVFDCVLDGGVFRMPDGSLAQGSTSGVVKSGISLRIDLHGSEWVVTQVGNQPDACL